MSVLEVVGLVSDKSWIRKVNYMIIYYLFFVKVECSVWSVICHGQRSTGELGSKKHGR